MKNLVLFICVLSLSYSCKQTQLISNNNKRSNKINSEASLNFKNFDVTSNEKRASVPAKSSLIRISTENQSYPIKKINKDELITGLNIKRIKEVSRNNYIHQRSVIVDSILKSNYEKILDKDDIEKTSKRAKIFSIVSAVSLLFTLIFRIPPFLLCLISFILAATGIYFQIRLFNKENQLLKKFHSNISTLKSNSSILIENDEVLNISQKTKKFSSLFLISITFLVPIFSLAVANNLGNKLINMITLILFNLSIISSLAFALMSIYFLIKAFKKIKKNRGKLKDQNTIIKKNLKLGYILSLIFILPTVIGLIILITLAITGVSLNI